MLMSFGDVRWLAYVGEDVEEKEEEEEENRDSCTWVGKWRVRLGHGETGKE
jgi:hypothetical protein